MSQLPRRALCGMFAAALLVWAGGCCHIPSRLCPGQKPPYHGPTLGLAELVSRINQNNDRVKSVLSHMTFIANIRDGGAKAHETDAEGDGTVAYLKPGSLIVRGAVLQQEVFELGANDRQYWLKLTPPNAPQTLWYGSFDKLNSVDPRALPIRPDLVLAVLSVQSLDTDLMQLPAPVMHYDGFYDAYDVQWVAPAGDHWIARRQVLYDRATLAPQRVVLFDSAGRPLLRADLSHPVALKMPDGSAGPTVPTSYDLEFVSNGSKMILTLDEPALQRKVGRRIVPNPGVFHAPDPQTAGVDKVINLDAGEHGAQ